jgi:hydrogenase maturation protease
MKRILIAGIGNVLLQDDGFGPCVVRMLEARYRFESNVEVADLGTPGLDLADYLIGQDCVILIDSVKSEQQPGTVLLYRLPEILQRQVELRIGPHAPALTETLLTLDLLGAAPAELLLVGVVGHSYEMGCNLSQSVQMSVDSAIAEILRELARLGVHFESKQYAAEPDLWWTKRPASMGAGATGE